jgi:transposase InsO family protein
MCSGARVKLAASTIGRMLKRRPPPPPPKKPEKVEATSKDKPSRVVTAREPHHVWHVDLTASTTGLPGAGFRTPWWPFALVLRWALSFHLALVLDHFSRALVAFAVFRKEPTAAEVCAFLDRAVAKAGRAPRYIVSDQGSQFQSEYRAWCKKNGVKPRFGGVGGAASCPICTPPWVA